MHILPQTHFSFRLPHLHLCPFYFCTLCLPPYCFISAPSSSSLLWFVSSFSMEVEKAIVNTVQHLVMFWLCPSKEDRILAAAGDSETETYFFQNFRSSRGSSENVTVVCFGTIKLSQELAANTWQLFVLLYVFWQRLLSKISDNNFHISSQTERLHSGGCISIQQNGTVR